MGPHRWQPTRLPHPWDSPSRITGVDCHFLLQCMKVKSESEVAQSCPTLSDHVDCSLSGSSVHGFSRQEYWSGVPLPSPTEEPGRLQRIADLNTTEAIKHTFTYAHSEYKLNKQNDNIQPCHTPFPILNHSAVLCPILTIASWPPYMFLRRQVRWSGIPLSI